MNRPISSTICMRRSIPSTNTIDIDINDSSGEVSKILLGPSHSTEMGWLDEEDIEETFQRVLKPRWSNLSTKGNVCIWSKSSILLTCRRAHRSYSELSWVQCRAQWHNHLSFSFYFCRFELFFLQAEFQFLSINLTCIRPKRFQERYVSHRRTRWRTRSYSNKCCWS